MSFAGRGSFRSLFVNGVHGKDAPMPIRPRTNRTNPVLLASLLCLALLGPLPVQAQDLAPLYPLPEDKAADKRSHSPSACPDRIVLTWDGDPATSQAVTWRTDSTVEQGLAQVAEEDGSPLFAEAAVELAAAGETLALPEYVVRYHTARFTGLRPDTVYTYRVGDGACWSEWFQFRTAQDGPAPFAFLYVGDAQNNILSLWSRTIQRACFQHPAARFVVHAGDLINDDLSDAEWGEWFEAVRGIHTRVPCIATPGNHEYTDLELSAQWRPQFAFPANGPDAGALSETVYYVDYQGVRVISLNTHVMNEEILPFLTNEQDAWLEEVLSDNPNRWTVVTHHHPMHAGALERTGHVRLNLRFKRLYESHGVDLVLQGHDHTYARGEFLSLVGRIVGDTSPVYVVSVSGPKMYELGGGWARVRAEGVQCYQVISVQGERLDYEARTAAGERIDAFSIVKPVGRPREILSPLE